jgi:hypothetical protein
MEQSRPGTAAVPRGVAALVVQVGSASRFDVEQPVHPTWPTCSAATSLSCAQARTSTRPRIPTSGGKNRPATYASASPSLASKQGALNIICPGQRGRRRGASDALGLKLSGVTLLHAATHARRHHSTPVHDADELGQQSRRNRHKGWRNYSLN